MYDSSYITESAIQIEIVKQNTLQPKILINYHTLKLIRIVVLGFHILLIGLTLFISNKYNDTSILKDFSFWMVVLSTVYFIVVVVRNLDKQPTNHLAGYFHAVWTLSGYCFAENLLLYLNSSSSPFEMERKLLFFIILVFYGCLSVDFMLNRLLLQKIASLAYIILIVSLHSIYVFFNHSNEEIEQNETIIAVQRSYLHHMLFFFISLTTWLIYILVHRYKYEIVKKLSAQKSIRVVSIKD